MATGTAGEYPHPPSLRVAVASMSDGEVFYHIRNGIRNTGMPAWDMPDRQIWQLVACIRRLPSPARLAAAEPPESDRQGAAGGPIMGSVAQYSSIAAPCWTLPT